MVASRHLPLSKRREQSPTISPVMESYTINILPSTFLSQGYSGCIYAMTSTTKCRSKHLPVISSKDVEINTPRTNLLHMKESRKSKKNRFRLLKACRHWDRGPIQYNRYDCQTDSLPGDL